MNSKPKMVILSAFFPPTNHVATNRIVAFVKYMSQHYDITVLTRGLERSVDKYMFNNGLSCKVIYIEDSGLSSQLLNYTGTESYILRNFKTLLRITCNKLNISHYHSWQKKLEKKVIYLLEYETIDVILCSFAPEDVLLAAYNALSRTQSNNVKWIIDFRDEYSRQPSIDKLSYFRRKRLERQFEKRADVLTTISEPHLRAFKEDMPLIRTQIELRNGYDHNIQKNYEKSDTLRFGYFGNFHGNVKPDNFFEALINLNILVDFKVFIATKIKNYIIPNQLSGKVIELPYMSNEECIHKMSEMDCNILILPKSKREGVYSGKIFDYISVQRSILALVDPDDVAAKLIIDLNCGYIANSESIKEIEINIMNVFKDWEDNQLQVAKDKDIRNLHREYQVQKLVDVLGVK